jgi:hypothetical protein
MRRRWREPAAIAAEIDRIRSLRLDALRRQWRLVFGRVPPAGLSKDLLGRMIAARLQERASLRLLERRAHRLPADQQGDPACVPLLPHYDDHEARAASRVSLDRISNSRRSNPSSRSRGLIFRSSSWAIAIPVLTQGP